MPPQTTTAQQKTRITATKAAVFHAVEMLAHARGEAQWLHGYRTAGKDSDEVYQKELAWWRRVEERDKRLRRALDRYRRALLAGAPRED